MWLCTPARLYAQGTVTRIDISDNIAPFAVLLDTWKAEEASLKDLISGTSKSGYGKIQFCGEHGRRDGLQYFLVDACCIDQLNSSELAEAINSMLRWYWNAIRHYVYLSDFSRPTFHISMASLTSRPENRHFRRADGSLEAGPPEPAQQPNESYFQRILRC